MAKVIKHEDGRLTLVVNPQEGETFFDLITSDEFFFKDLEYYQADEWAYIYDRRRDLVYWLNDYQYDLIGELNEKGEITLYPHDNDDTYAEYPWNTVYANQE